MTREEKKKIAALLFRFRSKKKAIDLATKRDEEIRKIAILPIPISTKIKKLLARMKKIHGFDIDELDEELQEEVDEIFGSVEREVSKVSFEIISSIVSAQNKTAAIEDALVRVSTAYVSLIARNVGLRRFWLTVRDDRVCPICEALDGKVTDKLPPAHPNCRCTIKVL